MRVAGVAGVALAAAVLLAGGGSAAGRPDGCLRDARLGKVAFARGGALHVLDLRTCVDHVLVRHGVSGPVRFVANGGVVHYGRGWAVPVTGGKPGRVAVETALRSPNGRLAARVRAPAGRGAQSIVV